MSKLQAVKPVQKKLGKAKILVFGKSGVGKTWAALDFPSVYYIDTEGGAELAHYQAKLENAGGVYFGIEQGSLDFKSVLEQIEALATEKHPYKTVVIDSITKIFANEIIREAIRLEESKKGNGFGADKKPAIFFMRKLINWLQRLDMNVVLIAHEKPEWLNEQQVGVTFDGWDKLEYELDLCLNVLKAGGKRTARIRKSRLEAFPEATSFDWSFDEFAKRYGKEVLVGEVKPIVIATSEQLLEINRLVKLINVPQKTIDEWFTKANVQSFEEMDTEIIAKIINFLTNKIQGVSK